MKGGVSLKSGVVDEHVDRAEFLDGGREHRLDLRLIGDVGRDRKCAYATLLDLVHDPRGVLWCRDVVYDHVRSGLAEGEGDTTTDPGISTGDEGSLPLQQMDRWQVGITGRGNCRFS